MQFKLIQILGSGQGYHTRIVRTWREFGEIDTVLMLRKNSTPHNPAPVKARVTFSAYPAPPLDGQGQYGQAGSFHDSPHLLYMADRRAEQGRTILLRYGEQCYLTVELDELFNDKFFDVSTLPLQPYSQACSSSSALFTRDWPLPEEDISGFTTHGKPIFSAAAFSSSKDLA